MKVEFNFKPEVNIDVNPIFPSYFYLMQNGLDRNKSFGRGEIKFTEEDYNSAIKILNFLIIDLNSCLIDIPNKATRIEKIQEILINTATAIHYFQNQGINLLITKEDAERIVYNSFFDVSFEGQDLSYFNLSKFYLNFSFEHNNTDMADQLCEIVKWNIFDMKFKVQTQTSIGDIERHITEIDESFSSLIIDTNTGILEKAQLYDQEKSMLEAYLMIETLKNQFPERRNPYTISELSEKGVISKTGYILESFIINNRDTPTLFMLNSLLKTKKESQYEVYKIFLSLNSIYSSEYITSIGKQVFSAQDLEKIAKFRFRDITHFYTLSNIVDQITKNIESNINTNETLNSSFEFMINRIKQFLPEEAIKIIYGDFNSTQSRWEAIMENMPEEGKQFLKSQNIHPPKIESYLNQETLPKFSQLIQKTTEFLRSRKFYPHQKNYENYFTTVFSFFILDEVFHNLQGKKQNCFRANLEGISTNEKILETIVGFQKNSYETGKQDISVKDMLSIYYYNRVNLNQNENNHLHKLFVSFYGMLIFETKIDMGLYVPKFNDCYDALVKLEIFWWYGFQVNNKEEMQATFNYIASNQWTDATTIQQRLGGRNKELFIKVLERTLDNLYLQRDKTSSPTVEEWKVFSIYGILKTNDNLGTIRTQLSSRRQIIDLTKIPFKIKEHLGLTNVKENLFNINASHSTKTKQNIFIRSTSNYPGVIWFKSTGSISDQIPLHFVSGERAIEITHNFGQDVNNMLGEIEPGDYLEEKVSHWGTNNTHNLLIAYNKNGEISTVEFHRGFVLNSLKVDVELYKLRINNFLFKKSGLLKRVSSSKIDKTSSPNQNISAETIMGVIY